ncbi:MAG: hypothetical protein WAO55_12620 [Candidatus Manganitrophaceae bacterium]
METERIFLKKRCLAKLGELGKMGWVVLLSLWGMVALLQQKIDSQRGYFQKIESFDYLPSGEYLRMAALEFKEAAADLLWLQAIQFVGGRDPSGRGYDWFYRVIDRTTDLDPKFAYAYQIGGIVLSVLSDHVDLSNAVLEKGLKENPEDWQIPFQLGFNHLYHLHDNLKAAHYMEKAAKIKGSPAYLPLLAARLYNKGGEKQTALIFLEGLYRSTQDEKMRERIVQRMKEILEEKKMGNNDDGGH